MSHELLDKEHTLPCTRAISEARTELQTTFENRLYITAGGVVEGQQI